MQLDYSFVNKHYSFSVIFIIANVSFFAQSNRFDYLLRDLIALLFLLYYESELCVTVTGEIY